MDGTGDEWMGEVMGDLGMNERAWLVADAGVHRAGELRIGVRTLGDGARVMDAGVDVSGGFAAGLRWPSCAWAASDTSSSRRSRSAARRGPACRSGPTIPAESCMASQYAGWAINPEGFFAMGSGPLRAKARVEKELFEKLGYAEDGRTRRARARSAHAPDRRRGRVGRRQGAASRRTALTLAVAPTASLAGGVQIVARVIETGLHKMDTLGFDVTRVVSAIGHRAARRRRAKNDIRAIGRTNDCMLYGGQARYTVRAEDDELAQLAERLPASTSPITVRRSTTSSSATTTTSIRSTRCCSAPPKCG